MTRVLVADDNPVMRELVREILESPDRQIEEAADGGEALKSIEKTRPDLVLLDIQMPVLDGFAVLKQLRGDPRFAGLPVVAITAYAMQGDRSSALAAGFDDYLTKPIRASVLRKRVSELLQA
jgi:two-component system, cell cycle response regulator DivK